MKPRQFPSIRFLPYFDEGNTPTWELSYYDDGIAPTQKTSLLWVFPHTEVNSTAGFTPTRMYRIVTLVGALPRMDASNPMLGNIPTSGSGPCCKDWYFSISPSQRLKFHDSRTHEYQKHNNYFHHSVSFLHRTKKKKDIAAHQNKKFGGKKFFRRWADFIPKIRLIYKWRSQTIPYSISQNSQKVSPRFKIFGMSKSSPEIFGISL